MDQYGSALLRIRIRWIRNILTFWIRIRWIRNILTFWIRIRKIMQIHGSGFKVQNINLNLQKNNFSLLKLKSERLKTRDYQKKFL